MARYTGPSTRIARKFGEAIFGDDKAFEKRNYPPGQHGMAKKRGKKSEYAVQLMEKQKAKYSYGILEKQFRNLFPIDAHPFLVVVIFSIPESKKNIRSKNVLRIFFKN